MTDPNDYTPPSNLLNALRKGLSTCNQVCPTVEYLERLAAVEPALGPVSSELRIMHDHLEKLCRCGLNDKGTLTMDNGSTPS